MSLSRPLNRHLALPPFFSLVALDSIDSTNEEMHRRARAGAAEGTLVWAREQTRGRGRRGRDWSSPQGNLYLSLLLRPRVSPAEAAQIGFVAAVALAETFESLLPAVRRLSCKWPNDLLIDGAKVSGILPEAEAAGGVVDAVVLGMGVNVASFPGELPYPATSLAAAGVEAGVEAVLEALAPRLQSWYRRWREAGFAPVRLRWLDFAAGLGESIEVRLEREVLQGRFAGLDASGALELELADGKHRLITAGDVFHPAG
jgi:BirA family transcriptional regulator, biotin operon repressor / biotin---[acetyl-CoA-carboxylase] ligase